MRSYEGAPRHNYEDALRSIGAILDQRGMRDMTLVELDDGFVVQGLALVPGDGRTWSDSEARLEKETVQLLEDDVARMMDEAAARRRERGRAEIRHSNPDTAFYESALRAIGAYVDQQQPRDIFLFEQERQFVLRLLMSTRAGMRHVLVEFTHQEIDAMAAAARPNRGR
jgi:hypothetical protein